MLYLLYKIYNVIERYSKNNFNAQFNPILKILLPSSIR